MIRFVRRRPSLLLRLLMLVVVALGSAGGALASALGDLHELSHGDHVAVSHPVQEPAQGHGDEDLGARVLHALVHCGHCHGQGGVLPFAAPAWDIERVSPAMVAVVRHVPWHPVALESLLRPPIQA